MLFLENSALLKRLRKLHPLTIDLSLGRIERLLGALDNPQNSMPPVIHVAGTNGKGSTLAFMNAMARAAGLKAHLYTSPHLVRFNERIRPKGRIIGDARLSALLRDCEDANDGGPITFFEITTAMAFLAFAQTKADITLLETGLGGRLDATNVIARPAACVITPISIDHQQFLGRTLGEIAGEKAGILRPSVPAIIALQHPIAAQVLAQHAKKLGTPLIRQGIDFKASLKNSAMVYQDNQGDRIFPTPALSGAHQIANAANAIAALDTLHDQRITDKTIQRGLETAHWPGRMQRLKPGKLAKPLLDAGFEVWLDGGHNPAAGRVMAKNLSHWNDRPLYLILGMLHSKDTQGFLKPLASRVGTLWAIPIPGSPHASHDTVQMVKNARGLNIAAHEARSLEAAIAKIKLRKPGRVMITGSLHLAGAVLAANGEAPK